MIFQEHYITLCQHISARSSGFTKVAEDPLNLKIYRHVSQLLGYSRVALPQYSFITAPQGASDSLRSLLLTYNRIDVLQYYTQRGRFPRSIILAQWDETAKCINRSTIITGDESHIGKL